MPHPGGVRLQRQQRLMLALMALMAACGAPVSALPAGAQSDNQKLLQPVDSELQAQPQAQRKLHGRFLHITDFHPDELYKVHSSTQAGVACHRGKGLAGSYGAEKTDCDAPFSLVDATFDWIEEHVRDSVDFVVWTGDSARHDSDEKNPRHEPEILRTNRVLADKFAQTFSSGKKLSIPVIPTFGNNDFLPHNIMFPGPNKWFQAYSDIWKRFIPEEQRHSFAFGGWFYVEVIPNRLAVFSLNTMYFFDRNAGVDGCAKPSEPGYKHMEWLRVQLQLMRERGVKAILMGHVPPARTDSKQNWDETCWQKYTLWLKQYRDVVTGALYGHMNIDHFLLQDTKDLDSDLGANRLQTRESLDDQVLIRSKEDYLQELRDKWSGLPKSVAHEWPDDEAQDGDEQEGEDHDDLEKNKKKKKRKKLEKIGGKHAERYQLSLVSPSVVPNYFPTLRIFEYNITGLDSAAVWQDSYDATVATKSPARLIEDDDDDDEGLDNNPSEINNKNKNKKNKKGKKGKGKKPKDDDLIIPEDPPEASLPGPAYYPQPFTLTGYTQYFANLTHINDDITEQDVDAYKWRNGEHDNKEPKHGMPKPRKFQYEVEYRTFDDEVYKLPDLTVKSYLKLAYRMGEKTKKKQKKQKKGKGKALEAWDEDIDEREAAYHEGALDTANTVVLADDIDEGEIEVLKKKKEKKKGKDKKKSKEKNKTWLRFLGHAFVSTVPEEELEKM